MVDPLRTPEPLADDEIHVWSTRPDAIQDAALLEAYDRLMTDDERARNRRFQPAHTRREHLVTRALLRTVLSRYVAGVAPEQWRFVEGRHGRPEFAPGFDRRICFNVSHTDGLIVCAITRDRELGVDVEALDRRGATVEIADRFFSRDEVAALRALPADRQRERFFTYWTLKEAYIKARGMGLAIPLGLFSFDVDREPRIRVAFDPSLDDDPDGWQFELFQPSERHRMAVGVRRGNSRDLRVVLRSTVPLTDGDHA